VTNYVRKQTRGNNEASILLQSPTWNGAAAAAAAAAATATTIASADRCLALQINMHQQKLAFWKLKVYVN